MLRHLRYSVCVIHKRTRYSTILHYTHRFRIILQVNLNLFIRLSVRLSCFPTPVVVQCVCVIRRRNRYSTILHYIHRFGIIFWISLNLSCTSVYLVSCVQSIGSYSRDDVNEIWYKNRLWREDVFEEAIENGSKPGQFFDLSAYEALFYENKYCNF